jgi:hypothetical protein
MMRHVDAYSEVYFAGIWAEHLDMSDSTDLYMYRSVLSDVLPGGAPQAIHTSEHQQTLALLFGRR